MTHRGMLWYVAYNQRYWPSSESDRGLVALPLFHKNALRGTVKPMLHAGGSFVLMPAYEPRAYLDALAKYKCTYSRGVAAVFTMFLQHRDYLRTLDLSALRGMTIGSAVVTPELLDAVERALPHVKVSESYGLTEGGSPLRAPIDGRPVPRGSPGVPAPDIELRLVDAHGRDAEEGELLIRCPYVCLGARGGRARRLPPVRGALVRPARRRAPLARRRRALARDARRARAGPGRLTPRAPASPNPTGRPSAAAIVRGR